MKTGARTMMQTGAAAQLALAASVLAVGSLGSGCGHYVGCSHELQIRGDLAIAYEPDRVLTVRVCQNGVCETNDEVHGSDAQPPERTAFCVKLYASARFINTPEERRIEISFSGDHEPDDDFEVDIWLEDGTHVLNLVLPDVDRSPCSPVVHEF